MGRLILEAPPIPPEFAPVVDAVVAHTPKCGPEAIQLEQLEPRLKRLQAWIEENDWDGLCSAMDFAIHVEYLAQRLNDSDLRDAECLEPDDSITDEMRINYAKRCIAGMIEEGDVVAIHTYPLADSSGRTILLGGMSSGPGGQAGYEFDWWGAFSDKQRLLDFAHREGFRTECQLNNPDRSELLARWHREV